MQIIGCLRRRLRKKKEVPPLNTGEIFWRKNSREKGKRQVEFRVIQKTPAASDTGVYEIRIKDNGNRYEPGISKAYCRLPADCLRGSPISP